MDVQPERKGLEAESLSIVAIVAIGISVIAPAYAVTSSLGPTALEVGNQVPSVLVLGFVPMFLVAMGYKELNKEMPDSGTTFTWSTRAFGPYVGWMGGWGFLAANIIVLSNLAGVAVDFWYQFLGQLLGRPSVADLASNNLVNVATCLVFMGVSTWLCLRGVATTKWIQYAMLLFQLVVLFAYAIQALRLAAQRDFPHGTVSLSWFNPFEITDFGAFTAAMSLSIFLFWGWDLCLNLSEETQGGGRTANLGATVTAVSVLFMYLLLAVATLMYAGTSETGTGLANPDNAENIFLHLGEPVLGPAAVALTFAVLTSSTSSIQSTMVGPSRALFAMSFYRAVPPWLQRINKRNSTPSAAIWFSSGLSSAFYVIMRLTSQNVLNDTITALGLMVCFYYAITSFACVWYFRRRVRGVKEIMMRLVLPLLGGIALSVVFLQTAYDSWDPAFGSGSAIAGVGLVFVLGIGILALGVLFMAYCRVRYPRFFREGLTWSGKDAASSLDS